MFFLLWRIIFGSFTLGTWAALALNAAVMFGTLGYTYKISRPTIVENGEILDPGTDLCQEGLMDYIADLLFGSSIIHFLSAFTLKAMFLWLLVLGYTGYLLYKIWAALPIHGTPDQPQEKKVKVKRKVVRK